MPGNPIANPSFETDLNGWTPGVGGALTGVAQTRENGWAQDGSWSLRLKGTSGATGSTYSVFETTPTGQSGYPVTPGQQYTAVATGNPVSAMAVNFGFRISIFWYKADGLASATPTNTSPFFYAVGPQRVSAAFTAPADAAFAAVRLNLYWFTAAPSNTPLDGYFDAVSFAPGNSTTADFEAMLLSGGYSLRDRGLMAGAAYHLRRLYRDGMVDPAAHTTAKNQPKQVKALNDNQMMLIFDAITAP